MDNADNREPYNRQYAHHQAQWTPWAMDRKWHLSADTFHTTRHRRHHVSYYVSVSVSSALQTPGNLTEFTMDTSRHSTLQEAIHKTLYTPQATIDTMHSAESRQLYNRYNRFHKYPWTMQTPGNHTTDNIHNTRHNGHHG